MHVWLRLRDKGGEFDGDLEGNDPNEAVVDAVVDTDGVGDGTAGHLIASAYVLQLAVLHSRGIVR